MSDQITFDFSDPEEPDEATPKASQEGPSSTARPGEAPGNERRGGTDSDDPPQPSPAAYNDAVAFISRALDDEQIAAMVAKLMRERPIHELTKFAFTPDEVSTLIGVGRSTVWKQMIEGSLGYTYVAPKRRVITIWDLLDFLGRHSNDRASA